MDLQNINWDDIEVFFAVAREGSFAKAATYLGLTQPTISRRVDQIERRLNTTLFMRGTGGVKLTRVGQAALKSAEQMARSAKAFHSITSASDQSLSGSVGISAPDGVSAFWIVPQLTRFLERQPDIEIAIDGGAWPRTDEKFAPDIALMVSEPEDQDLIRMPLCWMHYSYFASQDYISKNGMPESAADLLKHKVIRHSAQIMQRENWPKETAALDVLSRATFTTNSSAASLMAIRWGIGIGAAPTVVSDLLPDLVPLPLGQSASIRMYLCFSKASASHTRVRLVIDWLKSIFDGRRTFWFQEDYIDPFEHRKNGPAAPLKFDLSDGDGLRLVSGSDLT